MLSCSEAQLCNFEMKSFALLRLSLCSLLHTPPGLCEDGFSVWLFASFVSNNYNFLEALKAEGFCCCSIHWIHWIIWCHQNWDNLFTRGFSAIVGLFSVSRILFTASWERVCAPYWRLSRDSTSAWSLHVVISLQYVICTNTCTRWQLPLILFDCQIVPMWTPLWMAWAIQLSYFTFVPEFLYLMWHTSPWKVFQTCTHITVTVNQFCLWCGACDCASAFTGGSVASLWTEWNSTSCIFTWVPLKIFPCEGSMLSLGTAFLDQFAVSYCWSWHRKTAVLFILVQGQQSAMAGWV
jgi:hypothetical protein